MNGGGIVQLNGGIFLFDQHTYFSAPQNNGIGACSQGLTSRDPVEADTYYEFYIVPSFTAIDDDFEGDEGWTVGDADDNATTGIWVRVDPIGVDDNGTQVQPEDDASPDGSLIVGTTRDLAGQDAAFLWDASWAFAASTWTCQSNQLSAPVPTGSGAKRSSC